HVNTSAPPERADGAPRLRVQRVEKLLHADEDSLVLAVPPIRDTANSSPSAAHVPAAVRVEAPHQLPRRGVERHHVETGGRGVQHPVDHDGIDLQLRAHGPVAGVERPRYLEALHVGAVDLREVPQWARLKTGVSYPLRRGAWYQVVQLTHGVALLDVNHRSMTVPLDLLQVVPTRPQVWSVVPRPRDTVDMPLSWGNIYAV